MNTLLMTLAGALLGGGLLLIVRGALGSTLPLTSLVAELHRPRHISTGVRPRTDEFVERLAGRSSPARDADLAVCERTVAKFVQDRLVWSAMGAAPGLALILFGVVGASSVLTPAALLLLAVGGAVGGWFYARIDLRSDAERARREFRHGLASYLELVTILMAGGAGAETAMFDAAAAGNGATFRHIRAALTAAQARREPPWRALGQAGERLGIGELVELEASMTLAGGGAMVRDSLTAKAVGIRSKDLATLESEAQAKSETMVLPVVLMFAGFLVLIGYPALAALSGP